jgi:hypothetical protein
MELNIVLSDELLTASSDALRKRDLSRNTTNTPNTFSAGLHENFLFALISRSSRRNGCYLFPMQLLCINLARARPGAMRVPEDALSHSGHPRVASRPRRVSFLRNAITIVVRVTSSHNWIVIARCHGLGHDGTVQRHVTTERKHETQTLVYEGRLTADVPFGWARFQIVEHSGQARERTVFSANACRTGKDAQFRK